MGWRPLRDVAPFRVAGCADASTSTAGFPRVSDHMPGRGRVYDNFAATTGDTPLVRVPRLKEKFGVSADILLKCEFFNPMAW